MTSAESSGAEMRCKICLGKGYTTYSENQSPLGSRDVWNETIAEECGGCVAVGKCPTCGTQNIAPFLDKAIWLKYCIQKLANEIYKYMALRGLWYGVGVAPWRGNVRRKILAVLKRFLEKLSYVVVDFHGLVTNSSDTELPEVCKQCGFNFGDLE